MVGSGWRLLSTLWDSDLSGVSWRLSKEALLLRCEWIWNDRVGSGEWFAWLSSHPSGFHVCILQWRGRTQRELKTTRLPEARKCQFYYFLLLKKSKGKGRVTGWGNALYPVTQVAAKWHSMGRGEWFGERKDLDILTIQGKEKRILKIRKLYS